MEVNPFNPYFPAPDHLFANRSREQEFFGRGLVSGLAARGGGPWNIALVGPWGIGKTSLLRRFLRIVREAEVEGRGVPAVWLSASGAYGSFGEFARALMHRLADAAPRGRFARELERWEVQALRLGMVTVRRKEEPSVEPAAEFLYRGMLALWEDLAGEHAGLAVFIDDVQALLEVHPRALLALRSVFQDLQGEGARYPLVVSGPDALFGAVREAAEPVTRFFERMPVEPFSPEETAEAVRHPLRAAGSRLEADDEFAARVYAKTLGHPYFVAFVMRDVVEAALHTGTSRLTADLFDRTWPVVIGHLEVEKFEEEWRAASPAERTVLRALARDPDRPLVQAVGRQRAALPRLVEKGLVRRRARGVYELYHPLFAEYIRSLD
ncbi:MAG: AAA family ATPase [Desulfotomaculales bacterium]